MSYPRCVPPASRPPRLRAMSTLALALRAPEPSLPSMAALTSAHHAPSDTFRRAPARRIARVPSGHERRTVSADWTSAAVPATAGAEKLVPEFVSPTTLTPVPLAAISGSSRSPWVDAGLRKIVLPDIAVAVSSWLPTDMLLKPLWLTNSSSGPLPEASMIVGYGERR